MPAGRATLDRVWKRYLLAEGVRWSALLGQRRRQELWSLRDVSLSVEAGEAVGLIGPNGAGKTTALKLIAGITRATRGRVQSTGRIASLINLGAGFHRELTGRENVMLNGVLLGLTRQEVRDRFDAIVEFADLGGYIDTPVKQYSTGMYARLGFSVAVHSDPDVLLVDEVLSVGDLAFQDRAFEKMQSFAGRGCAVILVSHNLSAIEMMCSRTVWLDHGDVRMEGPTAEVVSAYLDSVDRDTVRLHVSSQPIVTGQSVRIEEVTLHREDGSPATDFGHGDALLVRALLVTDSPLAQPSARLTVEGDFGPLIKASDDPLAPLAPGRHILECRLERLPLLTGVYRLRVWFQDAASGHEARASAAFRVVTELSRFGSTSPVATTKSRGGFLLVPYDWQLSTATGTETLLGLREPATTAPASYRRGAR